jgi:hypothetical protein
MAENIRYIYDETGIGMEVPYDIFHKTASRDMTFIDVIKLEPRQKIIGIEELGTALIVRPNLKRIGAISDDTKKERRTFQTAYVLDAIANAASPERRDPLLHVEIGVQRLRDGTRVGMRAEFPKIDGDLEARNRYATNAMRVTANTLRYCPKTLLDMVGAQYDDSGVTFQVNDIGACTLDTDGQTFDSEDELVEVYAHNLYSHEMQLICLSGLIAITRA